jgi:undecaprenyl-diphosphatase
MIANLFQRIGRKELPLILALLFSAGGLWGFFELADEVSEGSTRELDRSLLLALRSSADITDPLGPVWLEEMMRDFTALGSVGVLAMITLMVSGYLFVISKPRAGFAVFAAVSGGQLLSSVVKLLIDRDRPDLVPHGAQVFTASFPSGHSMMAAVVYLTLAVMIIRLSPYWVAKVYILGCAVAITMIVGISRVYLGVHWPTDVLAGWTVGSIWAVFCWLVTAGLQRASVLRKEPGAAP